MSQIEQIAESYEHSSRKTENIQYGRLELYPLGASRFYTGLLGGNNSLFRSAPLGGGSLFGRESIFDRMERLAASRPLQSENFLTILDLPHSGVQLHIHEGAGGTAHFKTYGGEHIGINSCDAALADPLGENFHFKKILRTKEKKKADEEFEESLKSWRAICKNNNYG